jgi:hypothetical protein
MSMTQQASLTEAARAAQAKLDAHTVEMVHYHFSPQSGCPFWLDWAKKAGWDPAKEVKSFADLQRFPHFKDEWLRDLPNEVWVPQPFKGRPVQYFRNGAAPRACPSNASAGRITKSITANSPTRSPMPNSRVTPIG